jgi:hypothetical protein
VGGGHAHANAITGTPSARGIWQRTHVTCRAPNITHKTLRLPASAKRDDLRAQHRLTSTLKMHDCKFTSHVTRHMLPASAPEQALCPFPPL